MSETAELFIFMCGHASSGKEISSRIASELYPFIDGHILAVERYIRQSAICSEAALLFDLFYRLKPAFRSLKDYTVQTVFPLVLSIFDTKDKPGIPLTAPIAVLQETAAEQEAALMQMVSDMEQEAEYLRLPAHHPVARLLTAFTTEFADCKKEWHRMLQGWNSNCACFVAAHLRVVPETASSFETR